MHVGNKVGSLNRFVDTHVQVCRVDYREAGLGRYFRVFEDAMLV